jgi:hypothetical protein
MIFQTLPITISFAHNNNATITLHSTERRAEKYIRGQKRSKVFLVDVEAERLLTEEEKFKLIEQQKKAFLIMAAQEIGIC